MFRYVLFDLDGTLTDPKEGICKSVQYALRAQNIEEPDIDKLEPFIGPPLIKSFQEFYGMDEIEADKAVHKMRERFETVGLYENELYPGMKELLMKLKENGVHMAIASSKPREFVEKILKYFKIHTYFDVVCGSEKDGRKVEKPEVICEALSKLFHVQESTIRQRGENILPLDEILMVGDRKFDVLGAKEFGLKSLGVSYGYAPDGELEEAGADYITDNLEDLYWYITGEKWQLHGEVGKGFGKSLHIILPVAYEYVISIGVTAILMWGLQILVQGPLKACGEWTAMHSSQIAVCFDMVATLICIALFYKWYDKERKAPISHVVKRRNEKRFKHDALLLVVITAFLALFLNVVLAKLRLGVASEAYENVAATQYSVPVWLGLVHYGILKPLEEELLFRGLVYGRMRNSFSKLLSVGISALIFGAFHGNLIQFLYAFFMGCFLAVAFEYYKGLKAPLLIHGSANIIVYIVSSVPALSQMIFSV